MGNILNRTGTKKIKRVDDKSESLKNKAEVKSFHVKSDIQYRYAKTVVTSTVVNTADTANEIFFYIILPESAFISEFQMEIEGIVYKAHVKEKGKAKVEYNKAVSTGRTAGHVEYSVRDSNKFTVSVNVEKKKEVIFKLTYEELLKRELSTYKHFINIDPGQLVPDLKVEVSILESSSISILEVPPLREVNELEVESSTSVDPLVKIEQPGPNKATIYWAPTIKEQKKLSKRGVKGQLIVRYDVDRISKPEEVLINDGYFVHFFAPSDITPMRKHAIFVLDASGSMYGRKIKQLIKAMNTILDDMAADDLFSMVIMRGVKKKTKNLDQDQEMDNSLIIPATPEEIKKAKLFVNSLKSGGGTPIHDVLRTAIKLVRLGKTLNADSAEQLPEPIIIFLTDGQPTDSSPDVIVPDITSQNSETNAAVFSLGFGRDADMDFLKKLSLRNRGFARKIYEASDAALQLKNFYLQVASPLLSNVKFNYQDDKVDSSSVTRTSFPTLYQGSEFVVVGHLRGNDISGELTSRSRNGCCTRPIVQPVVVSKETSFMERMWAYLTIQQLLDSVTADSDQSDTNKKKALELALKYSFVTSLTSLVVVKPDDKTTSISIKRADEPSYEIPGVKADEPSYEIPGVKASPLSQQLSVVAVKYKRTCHYAPDSRSSGFSEPTSLHSVENDSLNFKLHCQENSIILSKANGLVLTSIEFLSNIKYQHAVTEVVMSVRNPLSNLRQGEIYIPLPSDAVISRCELIASNKTVSAEATLTSEAVTKLAAHKDNGVMVSREKNEEMKVTLNLKGNENVTVKIMYEEMVKWTGQHYQFVLNVHFLLGKIVMSTCIEDSSDIVDVKSFFEDNGDPSLSCLEFPASNKAIISWTADKEKQKQINKCNPLRRLCVTYGLDNNSTSEYIVTPKGYPLNIHYSEASQSTDIHWVIVINSQLKEVVLTLLDVMRTCVPTIISPQFGTMVFNSEDLDSAKKFVSSLQVNEDCEIHDALLKALAIPSTKSEHTKKVVIVLDGEKVDSNVVNEITSANKQANVPIFCLTFDETENIELAKQLAYNNSGVTRILYKECPLFVQISDFLRQVEDYLANPASFKYIEDQCNIDDFWKKSCTLSETSETKLIQLALEASIVSASTSLMSL